MLNSCSSVILVIVSEVLASCVYLWLLKSFWISRFPAISSWASQFPETADPVVL